MLCEDRKNIYKKEIKKICSKLAPVVNSYTLFFCIFSQNKNFTLNKTKPFKKLTFFWFLFQNSVWLNSVMDNHEK